MEGPDQELQVELRGGLTVASVLMGIVYLGGAGWLVHVGLVRLERNPIQAHFPSTVFFAVLPLGTGLAILLLTGYLYYTCLGLRVVVDRHYLSCGDGSRSFCCKLWLLHYTPLRGRFPGTRSMLLSNGRVKVCVHERFFPRFDQLHRFLESSRARPLIPPPGN